MSPCLISMSLVAMATATSTTTSTSRGVKSSFGGATPKGHLAKPGISSCEARDYCAVVRRVNKHLTVGSRSGHGLIPYGGGRGKSSVGEVYPGLLARGQPPPTRD